MITLRKATLGILLVSVSGVQTASAFNWATNRFFGGIDGLYLQPRNDDLDYLSIISTRQATAVTTSPGYGLGFRLFGGMELENYNDVTLSWERLHTDDESSFSGGFGQPSNPRWLFSDFWNTVNGRSDFHYDAVSGVFGHTHQFNNPWQVRFGAGAEYARINSQLAVQANGAINRDYTASSLFHGIGPRVEGEVAYNMTDNLALVAGANAALLIGNRDVSLQSFDNIDSSFYYEKRHTVVPKVALQLGLNYARPFRFGGNRTGLLANFEGGWEAQTYFNAVERQDIGLVGGEGGIFITKTSHFSKQGPYFGVKLRPICY